MVGSVSTVARAAPTSPNSADRGRDASRRCAGEHFGERNADVILDAYGPPDGVRLAAPLPARDADPAPRRRPNRPR